MVRWRVLEIGSSRGVSTCSQPMCKNITKKLIFRTRTVILRAVGDRELKKIADADEYFSSAGAPHTSGNKVGALCDGSASNVLLSAYHGAIHLPESMVQLCDSFGCKSTFDSRLKMRSTSTTTTVTTSQCSVRKSAICSIVLTLSMSTPPLHTRSCSWNYPVDA